MRSCKVFTALLSAVVFFPAGASGMDLAYYDLDSLVYLSTDIVIANISVDSAHKFTVTVIDNLYGSLSQGDRLNTLSDFLDFFQPLENDDKVILFLDRRPHPSYFLYPEASKSSFTVPPSGMYLIDTYKHVHEYYQQNNPGPYVAEGYRNDYLSGLSAPTKEDDLALPSLQDVRARIGASIESVRSVRPLLDKAAEPEDIPALMSLLDARSKLGLVCKFRNKDAICQRIKHQLQALNQPQALLRIFSRPEADFMAEEFVLPLSDQGGQDFTNARVNYLIQTLANPKNELSLRLAAVKILLRLSAAVASPITDTTKPVSINNSWLSGSAAQIRSVAKAVFDDDSQDAELRGLCVQFLPLNQSGNVVDARQVYTHSRSDGLRFAIEQTFLDVSDEIYEGLNPPGGPVASLIRTEPEFGCPDSAPDKIVFYAKYHETKHFFDRFAAELESAPPSVETPRQTLYFVLLNRNTGQRFVLPEIHQLWNGGATGEDWIELDQVSGFPAGAYSLALEYSRDGKIVSTGRPIGLKVADTPAGRKLTVMP